MTSWLAPGHTAVITGGASGIGLAAAQLYASQGMNVLIADLSQDTLDSALDNIQGTGTVQGFVCDVSDMSQVEALRDHALSAFGKVDCLMNNAGAAVTRALPWEDVAGWKKQIDINMWGVIHGCQAFVPHLLESTSKVTVINTGSKQGITNPPGGYAYNLSKAGVVNYTQSLAHAMRQIEDCPLSAHLLIPGFTYSNMIARFMPEKPAGAWSCEEVIEYMLEALKRDDFYILCPDNDTPRDLDNKRMQWNMDDIIHNRPALSRWHPDYAVEYEAFVADN